MSYQVLARKYRPQSFGEVVGQGPIVTTLQNAVAQKRVHHAYLFSGLRGVGKTTVARLMAKALNCVNGPTTEPCNTCASCAEIAACRALDVLEIDGASNRGIESVRELRETVRYSPARDRFKVYIIDEVHMLTTEAWNALLKTLEEPPAHVVFIFATTDYRKIPLTILSRCQHFEFKKIAAGDMIEHLAKVAEGEGAAVPPGVFDLIARLADGSLRDAQSALDQVIAFSGDAVTDEQARTILGVIDRDLILDFYEAVRGRDTARLMQIVEAVFEKGYQPAQFLEDLMAYGRDLLLARALADPRPYLAGTGEEIADLVRRAAAFSEDEMLRLLELMTREESRLRGSSHPRFLLEALAIKLARLADLTPIEELLARGGRPPAPGEPGSAGQRRDPNPAPPPAPGGRPPVPAPGTGRSGHGSAAPPAMTSGAPPAPAAVLRSAEAEPAAVARVASGAVYSDAPARPSDVGAAILARIEEERAPLGGYLSQAARFEVVEDRLEIAFPDDQAFVRQRVESRDVIDYLGRVAAAVSGTTLKIAVMGANRGAPVTAPRAAAPPGAPAAAPPVLSAGPAPGATLPGAAEAGGPKGRLHEEALREPMVRALLETFGGQIVDVEAN